jgi:hypothetical protein
VSTLPPERDLPEAVRTAVRSRVVSAAAFPLERSRRWLPVAAAAALVVVVGGTVAGLSLGRDPVPPPATTRATPPPPPDATLLQNCGRKETSIDPQGKDPRLQRVLVRFIDDDGIMLLVSTARGTATLCSFHPDGIVADPSMGGTSGSASGFLNPRAVVPVLGDQWGTDTLTGHAGRPPLDVRYVVGQVKREVARVVVTFQDKPALTVSPQGGLFIARVTVEHGSNYSVDPFVTFVAYDQHGEELGRSQLNPPPKGPAAPPTATATYSPSPTPPLPTGTDPANMLARCVAGSGPTPDLPVGTQRILTLFTDENGFLVHTGSDISEVLCQFDRAGTLMTQGSLTRLGNTLPLAAHGPVAEATPIGFGTYGPFTSPRPKDGTHYAAGLVRADVARLQVTWKGSAPVWAAIDGSHWAAQVVVPGVVVPPQVKATMVAFDRTGRRLGSSTFNG